MYLCLEWVDTYLKYTFSATSFTALCTTTAPSIALEISYLLYYYSSCASN